MCVNGGSVRTRARRGIPRGLGVSSRKTAGTYGIGFHILVHYVLNILNMPFASLSDKALSFSK